MSHLSVLPKLPVPTLSGTLDRFLTALAPLLSPEQFSETLRLTEEFKREQGPLLQEKVLKLSLETDNWAGYVSTQARYLTNRSSLTLTNGAGISLVPVPLDAADSIHTFLSYYIVASCAVCFNIRNGNIPQQFLDNEPLCMEQYQRLFSATRIPGLKIDSYKFSPHSNHIVVMNAGNLYRVPVHTGQRPVTPQEMYSLLHRVLERGQEGASLGLLTALDRDDWYRAREHLKVSAVNRVSLATIEECMFAVGIDNMELNGFSEGDRMKTGMFGDFKNNFPEFNRWFGICHQSFFSRDGWVSSTSEHSLFDGGVLPERDYNSLSLIDEDTPADSCLQVELLEWDLSPFIILMLKAVRDFLRGVASGYDLVTLSYAGHGRDFIRDNGLYYQGYMQLAIQLAYHKLYHGLCPTYQPVSLRKYRWGRLEHPHTVTRESKEFIEAMNNNNNNNKYRLMVSALKKHKVIMNDVTIGNVYCKHLLALKLVSEQEDWNVELFQHEAFRVFTEHNLVTSGISGMLPMISNHPVPCGRGHFVVFYPLDDTFKFSITTRIHSPNCISSQEFGAQLCIAMDEMQMVVTKATNGMLTSKL